MAKISFRGMCNGTQKMVSRKTGNAYHITEFVEVSDDGMHTFQVFGDLGMARSLELRDYALTGKIVKLADVQAMKMPDKSRGSGK